MNVVLLPPIRVTCGLPFSQSYRLEDPTADTPTLDLTGYTGTVAVSEKPFETPFHESTVTITATDQIIVSLTAAETRLFADYALARLKGGPTAFYQINLTAPVAENSMTLQGPAIIEGTL